MTKQVKGILNFYERNLAKKQKRLERTQAWLGHRLYSRLPGLKWMLKRQLNGVNIAKDKILNHKQEIRILQNEGKINIILD